jgi:hypothetical protein
MKSACIFFYTILTRTKPTKYGPIKLICNRVHHGFESVRLLRLICRDLTCVSRCDYWSVEFSNDIGFRIHGLQINLIDLYFPTKR